MGGDYSGVSVAKRTLVRGTDGARAHRGRRAKDPSSELRIFVNYRREETSGHAGRLYDDLVERFGEGQVFMDVDTIQPGADFTEAVQEAVGACDAFVAVIGRQWLQVVDTRGRRRLDNPEDFVRLEIEAALDRNVRVIPALVQDSEMPPSDELPETLGALARRNALKLSDDRWRYDVSRLVAALETFAREKEERASAEQRELAQRAAATRESAGRERNRSTGPPSPPQRRRASAEPGPIAWWRRLPKRLVFAVAAVAVVGVGAAFAQNLIGSEDPAPPRAAAVDVPKLVGIPRARAVSALRRLGLRANVVSVRGAGKKGIVMAQVPARGRSVTPGATVQLEIAAGPKPKVQPAGIKVQRFQRAPGAGTIGRLARQGLRIRVVRVASARPEGLVLEQSPRPGKRVRKGSRVKLTVSAGLPAPVDPDPNSGEDSGDESPGPAVCRDALGRPCPRPCPRRDRLGRCIG